MPIKIQNISYRANTSKTQNFGMARVDIFNEKEEQRRILQYFDTSSTKAFIHLYSMNNAMFKEMMHDARHYPKAKLAMLTLRDGHGDNFAHKRTCGDLSIINEMIKEIKTLNYNNMQEAKFSFENELVKITGKELVFKSAEDVLEEIFTTRNANKDTPLSAQSRPYDGNMIDAVMNELELPARLYIFVYGNAFKNLPAHGFRSANQIRAMHKALNCDEDAHIIEIKEEKFGVPKGLFTKDVGLEILDMIYGTKNHLGETSLFRYGADTLKEALKPFKGQKDKLIKLLSVKDDYGANILFNADAEKIDTVLQALGNDPKLAEQLFGARTNHNKKFPAHTFKNGHQEHKTMINALKHKPDLLEKIYLTRDANGHLPTTYINQDGYRAMNIILNYFKDNDKVVRSIYLEKTRSAPFCFLLEEIASLYKDNPDRFYDFFMHPDLVKNLHKNSSQSDALADEVSKAIQDIATDSDLSEEKSLNLLEEYKEVLTKTSNRHRMENFDAVCDVLKEAVEN